MEVRLRESEHDQLDGSDSHIRPSPSGARPGSACTDPAASSTAGGWPLAGALGKPRHGDNGTSRPSPPTVWGTSGGVARTPSWCPCAASPYLSVALTDHT